MREMARVITIRARIMDDGKLAESDVGERKQEREESGRFARRQHKRVDACAGRLLLAAVLRRSLLIHHRSWQLHCIKCMPEWLSFRPECWRNHCLCSNPLMARLPNHDTGTHSPVRPVFVEL